MEAFHATVDDPSEPEFDSAMQRNMDTVALDRIVFGRNELAPQHSRDPLDEALRDAE